MTPLDGTWTAFLAACGWAVCLWAFLGATRAGSNLPARLAGLAPGVSRADVSPSRRLRAVITSLPPGLVRKWRPADAEAQAILLASGVDPVEVHTVWALGGLALAVGGLVAILGGFGPAPATVLVLTLGLAVAGPRIGLARVVARHRAMVESELPQVADLMTLAAESGLELTEAIRLASDLGRGPVSRALGQALSETSAGLEIGAALSQAARRVGGRAFGSFVGALVQGLELGTPVARVLHDLADSLRVRRRQSLETRISALPVKLTVATIIFFVPALLVLSVLPNLLAFLGSGW